MLGGYSVDSASSRLDETSQPRCLSSRGAFSDSAAIARLGSRCHVAGGGRGPKCWVQLGLDDQTELAVRGTSHSYQAPVIPRSSAASRIIGVHRLGLADRGSLL